MSPLQRICAVFFEKVVLGRPRITICFMAILLVFLGYMAKDFTLDASAESLMIENDADLFYSRTVDARYGIHNYLLIAYTPKDDLFSNQTLERLARLQAELEVLPRVSSVASILNAPLLESATFSMDEMPEDLPTLMTLSVDREAAGREFQMSPLYRNLLVDPDLKHTAIQINYPLYKEYRALLNRRLQLRGKQRTGSFTDADRAEMTSAETAIRQHQDLMRETEHQDIVAVRKVMDKYRSEADLFLGGLWMIADDMIQFVRNDLKIFGISVPVLLALSLWVIFRRIGWVILPLLCCVAAVVAMMGLLGIYKWEVTVISSNFVSLQLIITMAIVIYLIVRYREISANNPEAPQRQLVLETILSKIQPCMYAALTTITGFASLLLCDILPVINFGWMMCTGILVSLIITFTLFPAILVLLPKETIGRKTHRSNASFTLLFAKFTHRHGRLVLVVSMAGLVFGVFGISRLTVENSFIGYFKESTEIYQGMKVLDQHLGGTTPLDVVIRFEDAKAVALTGVSDALAAADTDFDEFEEFEDAETEERYWFTSSRMDRVVKIHDYLDDLPETGKVLSLRTFLKIAESFNDGKPLDTFQLTLLYNKLPEKFKSQLINRYVSIPHNEVRFDVRIRDSFKTLKRNELLKKIEHDLVHRLSVDPARVHLTGVMVLYNNMLQSLFMSQILSIGVVFLSIFCMLCILFQSIKIALIALFPNLLAAGTVLGVMGWLRIPMDLMTITIAAISIGIAVDTTIHYIYRFRKEIGIDQDYLQAMYRCHGSIGHAIYYTSLTIIIGFSILALSNFLPTIYFGLLTGLAMLIALLGTLTLLPRLLIVFRPFGSDIKRRV